jgi:parallel beta-helix repeat protein
VLVLTIAQGEQGMNSINRFAAFTLVVMVTMCAGSSAKTLVVGKSAVVCDGATYNTISAALSAASPYDVVEVCADFYPEQLTITKPVTVRGIAIPTSGTRVNRVVIRPVLTGTGSLATITVANTSDVVLENLAVDASDNNINGCTPAVSAIHYVNSSGKVLANAISGAHPETVCSSFLGNGYGVLIDTDGTSRGPFHVSVEHNSIHDYARDGVFAIGAGVFADITGNSISGVGPSSGSFQWGVFILNGAFARVRENNISEGLCGSLPFSDCFALRSEGVVLRIAANGTVVDENVITNAQFGIFLNGGNEYRVTNNRISNIDGQSGIHLQGHAPGDTTTLTNTLVQGNTIYHLLPLANQVCGVDEEAGSGLSGNYIAHNVVNDAYCGVAQVFTDVAVENRFFNTEYEILDADLLER